MKKWFGKTKKNSNSDAADDAIKDIGAPTNVKHNWHVGFNVKTGQFEGLPPAWVAWLGSSNIR